MCGGKGPGIAVRIVKVFILNLGEAHDSSPMLTFPLRGVVSEVFMHLTFSLKFLSVYVGVEMRDLTGLKAV